MRCRDNRNPERTDDAEVEIKVNRNLYMPEFQGTPYKALISETAKIDSSVIELIARDRDRQVCGLISTKIHSKYYFDIFFKDFTFNM